MRNGVKVRIQESRRAASKLQAHGTHELCSTGTPIQKICKYPRATLLREELSEKMRDKG